MLLILRFLFHFCPNILVVVPEFFCFHQNMLVILPEFFQFCQKLVCSAICVKTVLLFQHAFCIWTCRIGALQDCLNWFFRSYNWKVGVCQFRTVQGQPGRGILRQTRCLFNRLLSTNANTRPVKIIGGFCGKGYF